MITSSPSTLEETIRHSGEGWLIDWFAPPEKAMGHIRDTLQAVHRQAQERLGEGAPDLSEAAIVEEYRRKPRQVRAFFQALGGSRTPEMLLMVWRIIQGMEVKDIQLSYHRQKSFKVDVVLESQDGEQDERYTSTNVHDFALFRHIGILEIGGRPVLDGFYALRVRET
jgi:hypothetical protein